MRELIQAADGLSAPQAQRRLFLLYLLVMFATHSSILTGVRVWGSVFVIVALMLPELASRSAYWQVLSFTMALDLFIHYPSQANHYWLSLYIAFFFAIATYREEQDTPLAFNVPRALLVAVFAFATLQKVMTPYFTSGRLLANYFLRGTSLTMPLAQIFNSHPDAVQAYLDAFGEISASTLLAGTAVPLTLPGPAFITICIALTAGIIFIEGAVFLALATNKSFEHPALPLLMIAFVWGTYFFRGECSFFALLCYLFFLSQPRMAPVWKALLLLSMAGFLALDAANVGTIFT
jgi:hypothetical protein